MDVKLARVRWDEWLAALVLVGLLSWASKVFTRADTGVSAIWLSNGLLLGLLVTAPRERRAGLMLAGFLGAWLTGGPLDGWITSAVIAASNLVEVYLGSARQRPVAEAQDLTNPLTFTRFLWFAVLLGPLVAAVLHVGYVYFTVGQPRWNESLSAFISHALGMATFAPVTIAIRRGGLQRLLRRDRIGEFALLLTAVLLVTVLVFIQEDFPLLFLVFPAMLLMTMRTGFAGTAVAVALVVFVSVACTLAGHGPLSQARGTFDQNLFILQVFIATLLLTMFPVVVVLAGKRRAHHAQRRSALKLQLLAEHSTDVIVLTDVAANRLYVSPAVREVLGYTPEEFAQLDFSDYMHPEDRERVAAELSQHARTGDRVSTTYRAFRKDGREIWLEAVICTFESDELRHLADPEKGLFVGGPSGREGRVVTLRDITRRKRTEEALAQANSELASLVWKDPLTGLGNRRRFDEALAEEWDRCLRAGQPLSVVMVDVDWFKAFNDRYGHQQGDYRLIAVAGAISDSLFRPRDVAVRYGGEEFAVILPATGVDEAGLVAERIRENVMRIDPGPGVREGVTASLGVAGAVPLSRGRAEDIVKAADDALYTSKREGRNRTTLLQVNWPVGGASVTQSTDVSGTG